MKVREYLESFKHGAQVTFIKTHAVKDDGSPFYHAEYITLPIRFSSDWLWSNNSSLLDCVILNDKQPPIDWLSGSNWQHGFNRGWLKCLLIIGEEDFEKLFPSKEQRDRMEQYIERVMKGETK